MWSDYTWPEHWQPAFSCSIQQEAVFTNKTSALSETDYFFEKGQCGFGVLWKAGWQYWVVTFVGFLSSESADPAVCGPRYLPWQREESRRGRGQLACPDLEWRLCGPMIFPTRSSHWPIFWQTISPTSRIPQPFSPRLEAEDKTGFKMSVAGLKKQFYKASQVCETFLPLAASLVSMC